MQLICFPSVASSWHDMLSVNGYSKTEISVIYIRLRADFPQKCLDYYFCSPRFFRLRWCKRSNVWPNSRVITVVPHRDYPYQTWIRRGDMFYWWVFACAGNTKPTRPVGSSGVCVIPVMHLTSPELGRHNMRKTLETCETCVIFNEKNISIPTLLWNKPYIVGVPVLFSTV